MKILLVTGLLGGLAVLPAGGQEASAASPGRSVLDPQRSQVSLASIRGVALPASRPVRALEEQPEIQELCEAASELISGGEYARAVERLDQALDLAEGDCYELAYLRALAKYRMGAQGEARTFAELAALLRPGAADVHYLLGMLYRRKEQAERAIEQFRSATLAAEREPSNPHVTAAWFWLGQGLANEGYLTAACAAYARFDEAIWETHPEHRSQDEVAALLVDRPRGMIEARLNLLGHLGRSAEAIRVAGQAVERQPDDPRLGRLYARALLGGGRAEQALAFCQERMAERSAPTAGDSEVAGPEAAAHSPLLSPAVAAAQAANRLDAWLDELLAEVADGHRLEFAAAVARRLADAGQFPAAARLWQALATRRPDDPDAAWALAAARRAAGDLEQALTSLAEFVRQNPDQADVPHARLEAWMTGLPATDEFLRLVARLGARDKRDFATSFVLGAAAAAAQQTELAEKLFRAALEARPGFALAHVAWGRMLLSSFRWEEAQAQAQAALENGPELAAAHHVLAVACSGLDEFEDAEQEFRAAVKYRPDDPAYAVSLAEHYRRTANLLAAQRYFQQALCADPINAEALEELVNSYLAGRKVEIARAQLRRAEHRDLPEDVLRRIRTTLRHAGVLFREEHLAELAPQFDEFPSDTETGLRLARGLYLRDRPDEAFRILGRVLAQVPDDEQAMTLMARVQARRLEYGPAIRIMEQLVRRYPNRPDVHELLAENYLAGFRLAEARRTLHRLLELKPSDRARQAYRKGLQLSYVAFSEFDGALALLDEWIREDPDDNAWPQEKLEVLLLAGREQEAIDSALERLEPVAEELKKRRDQLKGVVEQFREAPNPALRAEGERLQWEVVRLHDKVVARQAKLVEVCMDARRFKLAEEHVRRWLAAEPDDARYTRLLVLLLTEDGRPDEALEVLKGLQPASPQAAVAARSLRARAEAAAGRLDQAVEEMESLLGEPPALLSGLARAEAWQQLFDMLRDGGRKDEALECCDQWLTELDPDDERGRLGVLSLKYSLLPRADRPDESLAVAAQMLELDPDDPGLNNDVGYTWVDAGVNLERATQMIRKAVAEQPLQPAYLDSLGWAYYKAGDFGKAQEYLRRAVRLHDGQDPVIYDHLADAAHRLGDVRAARRHWERALELIEEEDSDHGLALQARLLASIRGKLAALGHSQRPQVAPTAAEQTREPK